MTDKKDTTKTLEQLKSLSEALQGDLSSVKPEAALKMIDEWYGLVNESKDSEFKEIANGLKELKKLLKTEDAAHEVSELIIHLGEQTKEVAGDAGKEVKAPLQTLGKQLAKIGRSLAQTEDQPDLEELNSVVELLDGGADEIDSEAAVASIDRWYELLDKSDDKNLKAIATELKELKKLLTGKKSKGADISEKLVKIGEHTTKVAGDAKKGFKGAIQKLGKGLSKFGKSINSKGDSQN